MGGRYCRVLMHILHVLRDTDPGGAQVFSRSLAGGMERLGHEVSIVALVHGSERPGVDAEILGASERGVATSWALRSRMRRADVTVAHGPEAGVACARVAARSTPFVYRQVRDTRFWTRRPAPPASAPSYFRKAAAVVALSSGAKADLVDMLGISPTNVHPVPIGVRSDPFHVPTVSERATARGHLGLEDDVFVAVTVGALVKDKGIDLAIRAVSELPDVHLAVVGDGPERPSLERLAEGLADGRVTVGGALPDVFQAYAAGDVLVEPSVTGDSMPTAPIEASYCGLPTVASGIGSMDAIIQNGRTGLLVPPGDVQGLANTIELMRVGRVGRQAMGQAARAFSLVTFELDLIVKKWLDLISAVAASRGIGK